jgi:hypothetical protein
MAGGGRAARGRAAAPRRGHGWEASADLGRGCSSHASLPHTLGWGAERREKRARLPGSLGPGQVATACGKVDAVASAIAPCNEPEARGTHMGKARSEWRRSLGHHGHCIPHDGQRERNGEAIAPGCVAATVTQVVRKRFWKKQPRQWAKSGAHWLLQTRVQTLDGEVGALFKRWYPDLDIAIEKRPVAA